MDINFVKMNGAGNDFVLIDNRTGKIALSREQIVLLCDRRRGVGADGVLLAEQADGSADFRMRYFNSDGGEAEMCGNGARCFARFVRHLGWKKASLRFLTPSGPIQAAFHGDDIEISLGRPRDLQLARSVQLRQSRMDVHTINTGVPHAVLFVPDADQAMVEDQGREIRRHADFQPGGTNVNFVQVLKGKRIRVRTYERGVEAETLACGTGVVASAIISHLVHHLPAPVHVQVQGGDILEVDFSAKGEAIDNVRLKGPTQFVFEGKMTLPNLSQVAGR